MKYVISVSKAYKHRGVRHKKSTKKHWFVYYYDEGHFRSEQVSYLQAMYYKKQKLRRMKYICLECGRAFMVLVKSSKQEMDCPYCD